MQDVDAGVGAACLLHEREVGLESHDRVAAGRQGSGDPTHPGAHVEDAAPAPQQGVGQAGLAVDVLPARDELGELASEAPGGLRAGLLPAGGWEGRGSAHSPSSRIRSRAARRRRQYSTPKSPSAKPVRHIHSHQVRPLSSSEP